jgi:aminocarboxymuconate-semialdehyde decarboxylase
MFFTCVSPECERPGHGHHTASRIGPSAKAKRASVASRVVRSNKRRGLRIDIHCHYHNAEAHAKALPLNPAQHEPASIYANSQTREVNVKQMKDRSLKLTSIEVRLKDMDRMGIDVQAVSPAPFQCYYWTEPDFGLELSGIVNDRIAEIAAKSPDRFVGLGTVPLQNAELAVAELERCIKDRGMRGVEIIPNVNGMELTDPRLNLEKFFAKAQELDAAIFMHPLGFTQGERLVDHYFNNVIGNPLETTVAVSHLIFSGVMERHPKLKVILAHAGGYLAHYWGRMDHAHRARADCHTVIKKTPSSYLKKFYFDTITFDEQMLRQMIDRYGSGHVLLGTDYPYDMGEDDPVGLISGVPRLSSADRQRIMGANAARLLNIKI